MEWEIIEIPDDPELYEVVIVEPKENHLFAPGETRVFIGAQDVFEKTGANWQELLNRHLSGDYGDTDGDGWVLNEDARMSGGIDRVMSWYKMGDDTIVIVTYPQFYTNIMEVSEY